QLLAHSGELTTDAVSGTGYREPGTCFTFPPNSSSREPMRQLRNLFAAISVVVPAFPGLAAQDVTPPVATIRPRIDTLHGDVRTDNYFWIREKTNPQVIAYLDAENVYTAAKMKHTEALQQKLYDEMLGRIKENDLSVPYLDNGYWYYNRTEKGKSY